MTAETVIVTRTGARYSEKILIFVNCGYNGTGEKQEDRIFTGVIPCLEKASVIVYSDRPIDVLTRAVDTGIGLFMKKTCKLEFSRYLFHHLRSRVRFL